MVSNITIFVLYVTRIKSEFLFLYGISCPPRFVCLAARKRELRFYSVGRIITAFRSIFRRSPLFSQKNLSTKATLFFILLTVPFQAIPFGFFNLCHRRRCFSPFSVPEKAAKQKKAPGVSPGAFPSLLPFLFPSFLLRLYLQFQRILP